MRVCHIITRLIVGGAQENTIATVLGLRDKPDVEVSLISGPTHGPEGSLEKAFDQNSNLLRIVPSLVRPVHPWKDVVALVKLARILRAEAPDIVHTHSGKAGVIGRLAAARSGVPIIVHTIHGPSFGPFYGSVANAVFRSAEKLAARVTTHIVVVAHAMRDQYLEAGIGRPSQYTRILSGFGLEPFLAVRNDHALRSSLGLRPEHIVIGKIARLTVHKGHEDLLAIAPALIKAYPDVRFLLAGDGNLRAVFEARARQLGIGGFFVFAGLIPPVDIPKCLGIMDVLVHLSRREGLPRALPQAMAAGKPIVAFDCDGAREVCINDETGFLVAPGDHAMLSERLATLASDPGLRSRLGRAGREYVSSRFSTTHMVDAIYDLYLRLSKDAAR